MFVCWSAADVERRWCLRAPAGVLTSGLALLYGLWWRCAVRNVSVPPTWLVARPPLPLSLSSLPSSLLGPCSCSACCSEAWRATATPSGLHDNVQLEYLIHKDSIAKNSSYKNKARFVV